MRTLECEPGIGQQRAIAPQRAASHESFAGARGSLWNDTKGIFARIDRGRESTAPRARKSRCNGPCGSNDGQAVPTARFRMLSPCQAVPRDRRAPAWRARTKNDGSALRDISHVGEKHQHTDCVELVCAQTLCQEAEHRAYIGTTGLVLQDHGVIFVADCVGPNWHTEMYTPACQRGGAGHRQIREPQLEIDIGPAGLANPSARNGFESCVSAPTDVPRTCSKGSPRRQTSPS